MCTIGERTNSIKELTNTAKTHAIRENIGLNKIPVALQFNYRAF